MYVNIRPAGSSLKCQTFNPLNLTQGDVEARESHAEDKTREKLGIKVKYQHLIILSAVEQIEVSCRERRESVPMQVANRR